MAKLMRTLLTALSMAACACSAAVHASGKEPLAGFVLRGQTDTGAGFALARAIINKTGASCPSLEPAGDGDRQPMTPRDNSDKDNSDVTVCEATYPTDGSRMVVQGTSLHLPAVPKSVSRVAVFADTGCQPNEQKDCKHDKDWPFGERETADLLVLRWIVPAAMPFHRLFAQARLHLRGKLVDRLIKTADFFLRRSV